MAKRKIKIDMTGVETYSRASEGQHLAKLIEAKLDQSQGGDDMIKAIFEITKGNDKGCKVYENFPLVEKALWKLKSFMQAAGMKADGRLTIDLDKLEGKVCIIEIVHEDYNGQKRAKIAEFLKVGSDSSDEDEDEDDEEGEDEDDEPEEEEEPKKSKKGKADKKSSKKSKKSSKDEEEDDEDDDEDEDDEEDEKPVKKSKKPSKQQAKKSSKKSSKKVEEEPEEEDEEDEDDWEDDED